MIAVEENPLKKYIKNKTKRLESKPLINTNRYSDRMTKQDKVTFMLTHIHNACRQEKTQERLELVIEFPYQPTSLPSPLLPLSGLLVYDDKKTFMKFKRRKGPEK